MLPLYIFDIDSTLIKPYNYNSVFQVREGLYDKNLLTPLFDTCQIAIASFNNEQMPGTINGKRLGRTILDIQHKTGDSRTSVPDDFIQAWIPNSIEEMNAWGKNMHIKLILEAYVKKWGRKPPKIYFWDDRCVNVYLASKLGITTYLVNSGLTSVNIFKCPRILIKTVISVNKRNLYTCISTHLRNFSNNIDTIDTHLFAVYTFDKDELLTFINGLRTCNITFKIY